MTLLVLYVIDVLTLEPSQCYLSAPLVLLDK
jgi:hypothetical protein